MANPASITVTALSKNAGTNQPSTQAIDSNGTVPITVGAPMDRLILEIINLTTSNALVATVKAGANPPSLDARGDLAITLSQTGTAGDKQIIGPFDSARFLQADGTVNVQFAFAGGTPSATIRAYRLPKQV